ncbi:unnamed protein product [Alternaria sp. RS040]
MHSNISFAIYSTLNTALFSHDSLLITLILANLHSIYRRITKTILSTTSMTDVSSPSTSNLSAPRRIPTTTFDSVLPPEKISTWEMEDAAAKKRSSAELAASAKSKAGATVKSALTKADQLKKAVSTAKAKRDTDKQIRKAEKEHQKASG